MSGLRARLRLADSLHDRLLDGEAGDVMQGAVDSLDSNRDLRRRATQNLHLHMEHCLARTLLLSRLRVARSRISPSSASCWRRRSRKIPATATS